MRLEDVPGAGMVDGREQRTVLAGGPFRRGAGGVLRGPAGVPSITAVSPTPFEWPARQPTKSARMSETAAATRDLRGSPPGAPPPPGGGPALPGARRPRHATISR